MFGESFITPMNKPINTNSGSDTNILNFICTLEGFKTKCKNLHWAAPKKNIHIYLDEFLSILSDFQDAITEDYMGITSRVKPDFLQGIPCSCMNAKDFISEVKTKTILFYNSIPENVIYKGIASETETFIHNINKYIYLFNLSDIY